MSTALTADLQTRAQQLDADDPLARFRKEFLFPQHQGESVVYLCGNSLGLQPRHVSEAVMRELADWADYGVEGHFHAEHPWFSYHERFAPLLSHLVGAEPIEAVMMNSLTVNLHLLMVSFYRPTPQRYKILIESPVFPSDRYAVLSQLWFRGHDPADGLIEVERTDVESIRAVLEREGQSIALVFLSGVNYLTGEFIDMHRITQLAHEHGALAAYDLAHAVGNVPLRLHDWNVDFAAWCSYKYLNGGPGAVGGAFVHERHGRDVRLPRFAGWWGNDPAVRFTMPEAFVPQPGAAGWQVSNAPVLSMAACVPSLELFYEAGMSALRLKSVALTGFLEELLDRLPAGHFEILTPRDPERRGCQLSLRVLRGGAKALAQRLEQQGIICDFREPDVIRVAPVPLYNTFTDCWRLAAGLSEIIEAS
jgi:kynureninase